MAKTKEKKAPKAEKKAKQEEAREEKAENGQGEKKREPKEGGGLLLTVLTILLIVVGVGEIVLVAFMGLGTLRGIQAQRAYEGQQTENPNGTAASAVSTSYAGPWLTSENGVVTWRREDDDLALSLGGTGQTIDPVTGQAVRTEQTYPRTPSSPPASWTRTIDEADEVSVG